MIAKRSVKTVSKAFTVIGTAALYTALPDDLSRSFLQRKAEKKCYTGSGRRNGSEN